ncbi:hypothetical protein [Mesoplasma lactucae]|uniref:Uncharacterized protein n=1 Tax=Mesoplasma lactucae ATCC 49193 TaxID=81460 RepID=A0A291IS56_9MOLU|nr:hypothetical protein [Mesoplasma lactucae]ATG97521.1 hypothetical protein CP520_02005 [Mesoplasma lactucae ATCC 49193]ATZ20023.1 hypothetical protein MLACT_v1c02010 [Mesoplasma lactucae ATCC 49193]MCL8217026.1 hypothetical protein [Mesoplasma lactucae ATCC 49193]
MSKKQTKKQKQTRPSNRVNYVHIIFEDKNFGKAFFIIGIIFFAISFIAYVDLIITLGNHYNWHDYEMALNPFHEFIIISSVVAFIAGFWSSVWLILGFSPKDRLLHNYEFLKWTSLLTLNIFGYYGLKIVKAKVQRSKDTFNSLLLTDIYFYKKANKVWFYLVRVGAIIASVLFSPFIFISIYSYKETKYCFLENSDIRDKIAMAMMSIFGVIFFISIPLIIYTFKNRLYMTWMTDYDDEFVKTTQSLDKDYKINKRLNLWLDLLVVMVILEVIAVGALSVITYAFDIGIAFRYRYLYLVWLITIIISAFSLAWKKYYLETNQMSDVWLGLIDILTFNPFFYIYSMFFTLRANIEESNEFKKTNRKLNATFINILIINAVFILVVIVFLFYFFEKQPRMMWKIWVLFGMLLISLLWLISNLWKVRDYKLYLLKVDVVKLFDIFTLNFLGIITNMIAENLKHNLKKQKLWL